MEEGRGMEWAFNDPDHSNAIITLAVEDESGEGKADAAQCATPAKSGEAKANAAGCKRDREALLEDGGCDLEEEGRPRSRRVVERVHVSTAVVGGESAVLRQLFCSPFKEKRAKEATLLLDEEELPLMKQLLRLMYSESYAAIKEMDKETCFQLALLCDKYEAMRCLKACANRLVEPPLTCSTADQILDGLPEHLHANAAIVPLVSACKEVLCERFKSLDACWEDLSAQGKDSQLCEDFLALSLTAVKALLSSDVEVRSENTVFALVVQWLHSKADLQEHEAKQAAFDDLAPLIRFPQMGGGYLVDVVNKSSYMRAPLLGVTAAPGCALPPLPGRWWQLEHEALQFRAACKGRRRLLEESSPGHQRFKRRPGGRKPGERHELRWKFGLEAARKLKPGEGLFSPKWMVDGYMTYLQFLKIEDGENRERAALQVLILSVGDGGIISGGAGITYSISYMNQNGTQQMMLQEASTYVSNYQDVTLLQGRLHTFLHSWRTVLEEMFVEGFFELVVHVEVQS